MRNKIFFGLLLVFLLFNCRELKKEYINQIDHLQVGNGLTIHQSEERILYSKPSNKLDESTGRPVYQIYQIKKNGLEWSKSEQLSFSSDYNDYHPVFSPDGEWLYFNSNRPKPGDDNPSEKVNIWRVRYENGNWGKPEYLEKINTDNHESYPSVSEEGHLYFNSDRPGGKGSMDIYKAEWQNGEFQKPIRVETLNSADSENDLFMDPGERFIIFNRYDFETKGIDLFISYKEDNEWSIPVPLELINKDDVWELTPVISPDSKYFFYEVEGGVQWIELNEIVK